jgi:hypothetical protein
MMWRLSGLAVWLVAAPSLAAQWSVGVEVGMLGFGGSAFDTSAAIDPATIRPSPGRAYGLRVQRRSGAFGIGLGVLYSSTGVGAEGRSIVVEEKGVLKLYEVAPEVLILVARPGAGGALCIHLGPLLDIWSLSGEKNRTRVAAQVAVSLDWPMIGRLTGTFQAGVGLGPSVWEEDELPDGYARRATWRRALSAGINLRL